MRTLPHSIVNLIEELEAQYPQKCIDPEETREAADHYSGKAALVVELRNRFTAESKREKNALPKVLRS